MKGSILSHRDRSFWELGWLNSSVVYFNFVNYINLDVVNMALTYLSRVFLFKITFTIFFWCTPLILFPPSLLTSIGLPQQPTYMFIRLLGLAYVALCVGYIVGLQSALSGQRAIGAIWSGIVSNGGACLLLAFYGISGAWNDWEGFAKYYLWASGVATGLITVGLFRFGVRGAHFDYSVCIDKKDTRVLRD